MRRWLFDGQVTKPDVSKKVARVEQRLDVVGRQRWTLIGLDQRALQRRGWSGVSCAGQTRTPRYTQRILQDCGGQSFLCGPPGGEGVAFAFEEKLSGSESFLKSYLFRALFFEESLPQRSLLLDEPNSLCRW